MIFFLRYLSIFFFVLPLFCIQEAQAVTLGFSYQGISVDKGLNLQFTIPRIWGYSGLFWEISGNETAQIPLGENQYQHKHYILWHLGWCWEKPVTEELYWVWMFGLGSLMPKIDLEEQNTLAGILKTGMEVQLNQSFRSFFMVGIEMNLWNRGTGFEAAPYYARGTTTQFGFRYLF